MNTLLAIALVVVVAGGLMWLVEASTRTTRQAPCRTCRGSGRIEFSPYGDPDHPDEATREDCGRCDGTGYTNR